MVLLRTSNENWLFSQRLYFRVQRKQCFKWQLFTDGLRQAYLWTVLIHRQGFTAHLSPFTGIRVRNARRLRASSVSVSRSCFPHTRHKGLWAAWAFSLCGGKATSGIHVQTSCMPLVWRCTRGIRVHNVWRFRASGVSVSGSSSLFIRHDGLRTTWANVLTDLSALGGLCF